MGIIHPVLQYEANLVAFLKYEKEQERINKVVEEKTEAQTAVLETLVKKMGR